MHSLLETMYHVNGMGIAAIQVGVARRALIVEGISVDEEAGSSAPRGPVFIVNPMVTYLSNETVALTEGCLSILNEDGSFVRESVTRPITVGISYQTLDGELRKLFVDGHSSTRDLWFARCLLHELGHLDGELFTDLVGQVEEPPLQTT